MIESDTGKPYSLTFEVRPGYLYAYVEGDKDSYDISLAYWQETAAEADRLEIDHVLIDENIVETGSMIDAFRFATELPDLGLGRVAFVDRYLDHHETNAFGELVAQNRGLNCKIFNNTTEAEQWLLDQN